MDGRDKFDLSKIATLLHLAIERALHSPLLVEFPVDILWESQMSGDTLAEVFM